MRYPNAKKYIWILEGSIWMPRRAFGYARYEIWTTEAEFWTDLTYFRILIITLSYELRLRWFKLIWKGKRNTYNVHVLSFLRFWLHQGQNRLARERNFFEMLSMEFWTNLTPFLILAVTLLSELRLRWFKLIWEATRNIYNFYVLSFTRFGLLYSQN